MKTNFIRDFSSELISEFSIQCSNQFDIAQIEHFIHNPMPIDDTNRRNHILETRNRLDILIDAIKLYYETEDTKNPTDNLESN